MEADVAFELVQEDGLVKAVDAFHAHLPLDKMGGSPGKAGKEGLWSDVAKPHFSNVLHETGRGVVGIFSEPVRGYRDDG